MEWLPIESAPKDGANIFVWSPGYQWPEVVRYERYADDDAEEIGEEGYWTYSEQLLADATDSPGPEDWTHWMPLPTPPEQPK